MADDCKHAETYRGEDAPRRWGSDRTTVCKHCGMYRRTDHFDNNLTEWLPAELYTADISDDDDV